MKAAIATVLASALIAGPAAVAAGGFPGLPDAASFGQCQAYNHADENATSNAPVFQNATYEEDCEAHKPQPQDDSADDERDAADDERDAADDERDAHAADGHETAEEHRDERAEASDDRRDRGHATADERRPDHAGPP